MAARLTSPVTRGRPSAITAEEAEFLLSCGQSPHEICRSLGIKAGSVARAMERAGRQELAATFERVRRATLAHPCVDCGGPVASPAAPRCRRCATQQRRAGA